MEPFLEYFMSWNSHMFMTQCGNGIFEVLPPNQMDWHYKITKINDNVWHVYGVKELIETNVLYRRVNETWECRADVILVDCSEE